jgi:uroporphyrinogen-III synthase
MTHLRLAAFIYTLLLQVICSSNPSFSSAFVSKTLFRRIKSHGILPSTGRTGLSASTIPVTVVVALTREEGKNVKLINQIQQESDLNSQVALLELPCIEHADGPDYARLAETLLSKSWDYIAVTSPEAARVLSSAWNVVRKNPLPVAAVGKATEQSLLDAGIPVSFVPSKATAATLAKELELTSGKGTSLLYPASARAKDTLESSLTARGFDVTRLNTYDTVTANWPDEFKQAASQVQVVCFASPSSVKGWLKNTENNNSVFAACIGETSATACKESGWEESRIFFPEDPGLEGWTESIRYAMEETKRLSYQSSSSAAT